MWKKLREYLGLDPPKPLTTEEVKRVIVKALEEDRVEFNHPMASECLFNLIKGAHPHATEGEVYEFEYSKMEVISPFRRLYGWRRKYNHEGGFRLLWGSKGFGFGELGFVLRNGKWAVDNEDMSTQFIQQALCAWVNSLEGLRDAEDQDR